MSRIFITGDVHHSIDIKKLSTKKFVDQKDLTKDDYLIILGDFGIPWSYPESKEDDYWLNWLNDKNFTTIFIDGNHENFNALYNYPEVAFNNAKCHQLRNSIYHVKRGEVLQLNNMNILCMGGANSVDKEFRKENVSWWHQEVPNQNEWNNCFDNIDKYDSFEIVLTHDFPNMIQNHLFGYAANEVSIKLQDLYNYLKINDKLPDLWFFGHHHRNFNYSYQDTMFICLYENIVELESEKTF